MNLQEPGNLPQTKKRTVLKLVEALLIAVLIGLLLFAFVEVGGTTELAKSFSPVVKAPSRQFAFIVDKVSTAANQGVLEGLRASAQQEDAVITVYSIENQTDIHKAFEVAKLTACDGLFVMLRQNQEAKQQIIEAVAAGLRVVVIDHDTPDSKRDAYIGANPLLVGKMAGAMSVKYYNKLPQDRKVLSALVLLGASHKDTSGLASNAYLNGFNQSILTFYKNAEIRVAYTENLAAEIIVESELKLGSANVIVCTDPEDTVKIMNLLVDYNRVGDTVLIGSGNQPMVADGVSKGLIEASVLVDYQTMGQEALRLMTSILSEAAATAYQLIPIDVIEIDSGRGREIQNENEIEGDIESEIEGEKAP